MARNLAKFYGPNGEARAPQTLWERLSAPFRLASYRAATEEEWQEWTTNSKRDYPFQYWLNWTLPIGYKRWKRKLITDPYWWVRYRTTDRNHVIRIRTIEPGWMDRSELLLHSSFQVLVDFVERELPWRSEWFEINKIKQRRWGRYPQAGLHHLEWEINDPDCQAGAPGQTQSDYARAYRDLYLWWTVDRPRRIDPWSSKNIWKDRSIDALTDLTQSPRGIAREEAGRQAMTLEEIHRAEDQHMLLMLMTYRVGLWT